MKSINLYTISMGFLIAAIIMISWSLFLSDTTPKTTVQSEKQVLMCVRYTIAGKMLTATVPGSNIVKADNGEIRGDGFVYRMSESELCVIEKEETINNIIGNPKNNEPET